MPLPLVAYLALYVLLRETMPWAWPRATSEKPAP